MYRFLFISIKKTKNSEKNLCKNKKEHVINIITHGKLYKNEILFP